MSGDVAPHGSQANGPLRAAGRSDGEPPDGAYYAVGILPPAGLAADLHALRLRHDARFGARTMPHLTLKQPFRLRAGRAAVESIAAAGERR